MDSECLPNNEGKLVVHNSAKQQFLFLKALALVSDHIVIPPASIPFWAFCHNEKILVEELEALYDNYILISPIYNGMTTGTEFIEQKLTSGNPDDVTHITESAEIIMPFFKNLPVLHRNVESQSRRFRNSFVSLLSSRRKLAASNEILDHVHASDDEQIALSRASLATKLNLMLVKGSIDGRVNRQMYYLMNNAYYSEGAATYNAAISITDASRYSILGSPIFQSSKGIMLAYDPYVVLAILGCFGIDKQIIAQLTIKDILLIRKMVSFTLFVQQYHEMACQIQELELRMMTVSKKSLDSLQTKLIESFAGELQEHRDRFDNATRTASQSTSLVLTLLLGGMGTLFNPVVGFGLGIVPWITDNIGLNKLVNDPLTKWITKNRVCFHVFVAEVKKYIAKLLI